MPTETYVDDVFTLVQALTRAEITSAVMNGVRADVPDEVYLTIDVDHRELRPALAVQQSLQLSLDAAAIAVDYLSQPDRELSRDYVEAVLRDQVAELTIVDLATGSFLGRFSLTIRTDEGRRKIVAIAGLMVVALCLIYPPAGIALIVLEGLHNLNDVLTPAAIQQTQTAAVQAQEPLGTVDRSDMPSQDVKVVVGPRDNSPLRRVHVCDVDLVGTLSADRAFLKRVHKLPSVQRGSRFIVGETGGPRRIRIWSTEVLDPKILDSLAGDSGTSIVDILAV